MGALSRLDPCDVVIFGHAVGLMALGLVTALTRACTPRVLP